MDVNQISTEDLVAELAKRGWKHEVFRIRQTGKIISYLTMLTETENSPPAPAVDDQQRRELEARRILSVKGSTILQDVMTAIEYGERVGSGQIK